MAALGRKSSFNVTRHLTSDASFEGQILVGDSTCAKRDLNLMQEIRPDVRSLVCAGSDSLCGFSCILGLYFISILIVGEYFDHMHQIFVVVLRANDKFVVLSIHQESPSDF